MNNTIFKSVLEILPVARLVNGESNYDYAGIVIIFGTWISLSSMNSDFIYSFRTFRLRYNLRTIGRDREGKTLPLGTENNRRVELPARQRVYSRRK